MPGCLVGDIQCILCMFLINTHVTKLYFSTNFYEFNIGVFILINAHVVTPLAEQEYSGIHLDPTEPMNDDLPDSALPGTRSKGDHSVDDVDTNPLASSQVPGDFRNHAPTLSLTPFSK